jgi:hypothetical protein
MEANELRIGNLIYLKGSDQRYEPLNENTIAEIWAVDCYYTEALESEGNISASIGNQIIKDVINNYTPIPLTDEWLLKFGFEDWGKDAEGIRKFVLHNAIDGTSDFEVTFEHRVFASIDGDCCCWSKLLYVHQLQNLYFALTGEELTIVK